MTSTPSPLERRLERLLAATRPPTVRPKPAQPKARVDFVYLAEADQDLLANSTRR